ncbi:unnamed protein product [Alternaria alternata]
MPDQLVNSHSPLLVLPAEILLLVFDCFFDAQQPQIRLESTERCYYNYSKAFSTLNALERTCRSLRPIAKEVLNTKCLWKFHKPVAAFTEGHSIRRKATHIEILRDAYSFPRPRDDYPWRPREKLEQELNTWGYCPIDVKTALHEDPAQLELAFLVASSPDLQTFIMDGHHNFYGISSIDQRYELPVWLIPIIQVARKTPLNGMDHSFYRNLQTLDIEMQFSFDTSLAYLFLLPTLQTLRLSWMVSQIPFEDEANWPVKSRSSSVASLILDQAEISGTLIRLLITSCRELSCFKYSNGSVEEMPLSCSAEIMSGLAQQQDTLRTLYLEPHQRGEYDYEGMTLTRIDGFHKLYALERLYTPFWALLGKPQSTYTGEESWQYPQMRNVLPPRLQELSLYILPVMLSQEYNDGYLSLFSSALPSDTKDLYLKWVHVECENVLECAPLPFDFWDIKNVFLEQGVDFDYIIGGYEQL